MNLTENQNVLKKIESLTDGGKLAIVLCANAFRFGGNWGFIKGTDPNFRNNIEIMREERSAVRVHRLSNGALVLADENFLAYNVNSVLPNFVDGSFVEMAKKRKANEKERFLKFVKRVAEGKSTHVKSAGGYHELTIGIYCVNETNLIRVKGKDYPSYKLNLIEALEYVNQLTKTGKKVYARAVNEKGEEVFDQVFNLASNTKGLTALYRGLEIADSDTGVFLTLRIK